MSFSAEHISNSLQPWFPSLLIQTYLFEFVTGYFSQLEKSVAWLHKYSSLQVDCLSVFSIQTFLGSEALKIEHTSFPWSVSGSEGHLFSFFIQSCPSLTQI